MLNLTKKAIKTSGKRKRAIARATIKAGTGVIRVNSMLIDVYQPEIARMRLREPLILAGEIAGKVNIDVNISGGGMMSGADAGRLAIAKALVAWGGKEALRERFLQYDRNMLVADVRRKEPCKPNDSRARAKRQKSYR